MSCLFSLKRKDFLPASLLHFMTKLHCVLCLLFTENSQPYSCPQLICQEILYVVQFVRLDEHEGFLAPAWYFFIMQEYHSDPWEHASTFAGPEPQEVVVADDGSLVMVPDGDQGVVVVHL